MLGRKSAGKKFWSCIILVCIAKSKVLKKDGELRGFESMNMPLRASVVTPIPILFLCSFLILL